jgi:hypothetical protein
MSAPRYSEVVLQGPEGWTHGFLEAYFGSRGVEAEVIDAEREGFDCSPLRERLRDLLDSEAATLHLLLPEPALAALPDAVREAAESGRTLAVRGSRPLRGARFRFDFRIHSREHAEPIRRDFSSPPPGASLAPGARFDETVRPDAAGPEMFAPDHDYTLDGEGTIEGDVPAVLALHRRYRDEELVRLQDLHLLGDPD